MSTLTVTALTGIPEVRPGDDVAGLLLAAAAEPFHHGDVLVLAHKIVSKAEGQIRRLADIEPSERALELAARHAKDARHVQAVLDEAASVMRAKRGVLICVTHHGFICANAGVDASNTAQPETLILLPRDPDASARRIRARLHELTGARPAVLITDSFGRPWRRGQTDIAIGCAGLQPLEDWRGRLDAGGRALRATWIAAADQLAAAADLARTKDGRQPAVRVSGAERFVTHEDGPGARALLRPEAEDLFR